MEEVIGPAGQVQVMGTLGRGRPPYLIWVSPQSELGSVLGSTWVHLRPDLGESAEC